MKQIIAAFFLCMLLWPVSGLRAQNIQLHYDFGRSLYDKDLKGRPLLTSTVEKFHPDAWGSTYFFVDMDYITVVWQKDFLTIMLIWPVLPILITMLLSQKVSL